MSVSCKSPVQVFLDSTGEAETKANKKVPTITIYECLTLYKFFSILALKAILTNFGKVNASKHWKNINGESA
jgi:hypothetical protein